MTHKSNDLIGLGNALMDFLVEVDDHKLLEFNLKKGEMHLVEEEKAKEILHKINHYQLKIETVPGGSAANTLRAFAFLGGKAILCGKVGKDKHGEMYVQEMNKQGVQTRINNHTKNTGHAVTFITPDSQRTFSVHLGAALELYKEDILEEDIQKSKILHIEGYQIEGQTKETVLQAIQLAQKNNTLISLDLADPGVIRRNKSFLKELVAKVDIIFLNEEEAKEYTGLQPEEAAKDLGRYVKTVVVKRGAQGSLIYHHHTLTKIGVFPAKAIDTAGAGDCYAAGFLYGYCQGWELEKAGKLGSLLASRIVEQKGVAIGKLNATEIKSKLL